MVLEVFVQFFFFVFFISTFAFVFISGEREFPRFCN